MEVQDSWFFSLFFVTFVKTEDIVNLESGISQKFGKYKTNQSLTAQKLYTVRLQVQPVFVCGLLSRNSCLNL
jgi:hypothetical protein